ncbi:MAG: 3-phosphoglycerate dehydrogenase family protein [Phycisphaerales bacterium]|jgi:D-3-phosphoglycerate dehydrogenase|nr:3-phosphoglycerate dehydrogenase family protein [Phycisphaerales bacterium]MDP6987389.1 3-phosphoglycerate dehydrogenase family protein [Phycisphaerales bacterium]
MNAQVLTTDAPECADTSAAPTILIADTFSQTGLSALRDLGCAVHVDAGLDAESLPEAVRTHQPNAIIVRSTKVPKTVFETADHLGLVVRAGAGYDTIDVAAASVLGISVANCPGMNAIAVAELAWGLILSCDRRIPDQTVDLRAGVWAKKQYAKAEGLYGRTLGIIGLGRIGREVANRGLAFGMKVIGWDPNLTESQANAMGVGYCEDLLNLAKMSDVISIHVAAVPETTHLVGPEFCDALKPGAILINTSRGSVVDESAVTEAIRSKGVRAGLDVFATEPKGGDSTFADAIVQEPGVIGTHHVGASTNQAQEAIAGEAVRVIQAWMDTGEVLNCVNIASSTPASTILTVRHLNRPGVLAHVFEVLGRSDNNIEEMENVIYQGGEAAVARIQVDGPVSPDDLDLVCGHEAVLGATIATIPSMDSGASA